MSTYQVIVTRTERIAFELEADSAQDAEDRYLLDGDEVDSETVEIVPISTTEVTS